MRSYIVMVMGSPLNYNPRDLIEADLIASPIVEPRRARRGIVCHHRYFYQRAAVLEVGGVPRLSGSCGCPTWWRCRPPQRDGATSSGIRCPVNGTRPFMTLPPIAAARRDH